MKTRLLLIICLARFLSPAEDGWFSHTSENSLIIYPTNVTMGAIGEKYLAGSCGTNDFVTRVTPEFASAAAGAFDAVAQREIWTKLAEYQDGLKIKSLESLATNDVVSTTNFCLGLAFPYDDTHSNGLHYARYRNLVTNSTMRIGKVFSLVDEASNFAGRYLKGYPLISCHSTAYDDMSWSFSSIDGLVLNFTSPLEGKMSDVLKPYEKTFAICPVELPNEMQGDFSRSTKARHFFENVTFPGIYDSDEKLEEMLAGRSSVNTNLASLSELLDPTGEWGLGTYTNRHTERLSARRYAAVNSALARADLTIGDWNGYATDVSRGQKSLAMTGEETARTSGGKVWYDFIISESGDPGYQVHSLETIGEISKTSEFSFQTNIDYSGTAVERTKSASCTVNGFSQDGLQITSGDIEYWVYLAREIQSFAPETFNVNYSETYDPVLRKYGLYVTVESQSTGLSFTQYIPIYGYYSFEAYLEAGSVTKGKIVKSQRNDIAFNPLSDPYKDPAKGVPALWPHHLVPTDKIFVTQFFKQRTSDNDSEVESVIDGGVSDLSGKPMYGAYGFETTRDKVDSEMASLFLYKTRKDEETVMSRSGLPLVIQDLVSTDESSLGELVEEMLADEPEIILSFSGLPNIRIYFDEQGDPHVIDNDTEIEYDMTEDPPRGNVSFSLDLRKPEVKDGAAANASYESPLNIIAVKWNFPAMHMKGNK